MQYMGWRNRPTYIDECPEDVDYVMFIDENGDSNLDYMKKCKNKGIEPDQNSKYFTITGIIVEKSEIKNMKNNIMKIKNSNWENGSFEYKNNCYRRICFHSREIRRKEGPFRDSVIDRNKFLNQIDTFIENVSCDIISSTINKWKHYNRYHIPDPPYNLCLDFILERFTKYYMIDDSKCIVMLEARGKDEDKKLLQHIKSLVDCGTRYVDSSYFKKIKGVYFNPKWQKSCKCQKSYFGLEVADLCSYPIHKFCKYNEKDQAFLVLEDKIYKYPAYYGHGIKIFPK